MDGVGSYFLSQAAFGVQSPPKRKPIDDLESSPKCLRLNAKSDPMDTLLGKISQIDQAFSEYLGRAVEPIRSRYATLRSQGSVSQHIAEAERFVQAAAELFPWVKGRARPTAQNEIDLCQDLIKEIYDRRDCIADESWKTVSEALVELLSIGDFLFNPEILFTLTLDRQIGFKLRKKIIEVYRETGPESKVVAQVLIKIAKHHDEDIRSLKENHADAVEFLAQNPTLATENLRDSFIECLAAPQPDKDAVALFFAISLQLPFCNDETVWKALHQCFLSHSFNVEMFQDECVRGHALPIQTMRELLRDFDQRKVQNNKRIFEFIRLWTHLSGVKEAHPFEGHLLNILGRLEFSRLPLSQARFYIRLTQLKNSTRTLSPTFFSVFACLLERIKTTDVLTALLAVSHHDNFEELCKGIVPLVSKCIRWDKNPDEVKTLLLLVPSLLKNKEVTAAIPRSWEYLALLAHFLPLEEFRSVVASRYESGHHFRFVRHEDVELCPRVNRWLAEIYKPFFQWGVTICCPSILTDLALLVQAPGFEIDLEHVDLGLVVHHLPQSAWHRMICCQHFVRDSTVRALPSIKDCLNALDTKDWKVLLPLGKMAEEGHLPADIRLGDFLGSLDLEPGALNYTVQLFEALASLIKARLVSFTPAHFEQLSRLLFQAEVPFPFSLQQRMRLATALHTLKTHQIELPPRWLEFTSLE